jgi:uncharacterized membrane protein YfcA
MADTTFSELLLAACMFAGAALYTSVGHGGASAYIALMALFGLPQAVMKPTALALNIIAASFGSARYTQAGLFRWRTLWPFLIGALPFAFLGGRIQLAAAFYKPLVGAVLLFSAARLMFPDTIKPQESTTEAPIPLAIAIGALIGLLAGLTGTGGGIFLSPILLFFGWSALREASGVVALFIVANSLAGLAGNISSIEALPAALPLYAAAVFAGAVLGTTAGIALPLVTIQRALAAVLTIAGLKLIGLF